MTQLDYTEIRANPKRVLQRNQQPHFKDAWAMAQEERYGNVVGLARVASPQLPQGLQASGRDGIFYEPTAQAKQPAKIEWFKRRTVGGHGLPTKESLVQC